MNLSSPSTFVNKLIKLRILITILIVIGGIGLYFSTIISNPYTQLYPSILIISSILFLILHHFDSVGGTDQIDLDGSYKKMALVAIFMTFVVLISSYYVSGYQRTDIVIYLTFLLYLLVVLFIFTRPHPVLGLIVISIAGVTNRLTAYYGSALYNGVDIYSHSRWAQSIATDGSLQILTTDKHFYSPFYHLLVASGELIYTVPTRDAITLTVLIAATVLPILSIYLITSRFWESHVGLFAGFLYISADRSLEFGIHLIPTSLGLAFFSLLILSLMRYTDQKYIRHYLLLVTFLVALMFTHQVSLFIGITAIGAFSLSIIVFQWSFSRIAINTSILATLTLFFDFIVTKYSGPKGSTSFFDQMLGILFNSLLTAGTETRVEVTFPQDPSISPIGAASLTLIQIGGSALLLILAIIGALYWLSTCEQNTKLFFGIGFSIIVTILLFVTLVGPVVGMRTLLPDRWWAFTYMFLAILAAPGLMLFVQSGSKIISRPARCANFRNMFVVLFIIMLPYVVLMGGNHAGAFDDPLFNDAPGAEKMKISYSEKQLFEYSTEYESKVVTLSDRRASAILLRYYGMSTETLLINHGNPESVNQPSNVINREYIHTKHSQYIIRTEQTNYVVHGQFPIDEIPATSKQTTYSNGNHELTYIVA